MHRRAGTAVSLVSLIALAAGCTTMEPDPPEPTPSEPALKYDFIPYDPCAVIDLGDAEDLLGALEYDGYFNSGDAEPDSMQTWGETWCGAAFDDGTGQAAELVIRIYIEDEAVGTATEQDRGPGDGLSWPYGEDFQAQRDQLPEWVALPANSQWESSEVVQYPEVRDDDFGWDPDGKSLAVYGVFAESNVWLYAYVWRTGTGAAEAPDPEPYADLLVDLTDQVRDTLAVNESYTGP
jgi:hypothetical protein